jgi:type IV fimbrial biogenesis protein FimT
MYSAKGFSLFELLVVLVMVMIIVAIVLPSQTLFLRRTKQAVASEQLLRAISLMRSEARLRGLPVSICPGRNHMNCSGEWQDGQIIFVDSKHDGVMANSNQIILLLEAMPQASLYWHSSLGRNYLQIMPNGLTDAEDGSFWYCAPKALHPEWAIRVSQTGRARIEYNASGNDLQELHCP